MEIALLCMNTCSRSLVFACPSPSSKLLCWCFLLWIHLNCIPTPSPLCGHSRLCATSWALVPRLHCPCFPVQRQTADRRYSWVSFRNADRKLFGMYTDSVKGFKDRYFLVRPHNLATYYALSD